MIFGLVGAAALIIAAPAPVVGRQPTAVDMSAAWHQVEPQHSQSQHIDRHQEVPAEPVDVNRADEEQLQAVPGIGPSTARRIIDWRTENGRFERLEDLLNVRGIGVTTLEKLRPYVTVGAQDPPRR